MKQIKYEDLSLRWKSSKENVLNEISALIDSGNYILGKNIFEFENKYAEFCNKKFCIGLSSGLDALEHALSTIKTINNLDSNQEVLVPSTTYIATIFSVIKSGLKFKLVDPNNYNILPDEETYLKNISDKTKIILDVPLYGYSRPSKEIRELCDTHNLFYIEDCAQSTGTLNLDNTKSGHYSDIACWSFYPTKNLGGIGESGACTTDISKYNQHLRLLRNYGSKTKYKFDAVGRNSRMDEIQAILLNNFFVNFKKSVGIKREIANIYNNNINNSKIEIPQENHFSGNSFHIYPLLIKKNRDHFINYLNKNNIQTAIHYPIANHNQIALKDYKLKNLSRSDYISSHVVSLPIHYALTNDEIHKIVSVINRY